MPTAKLQARSSQAGTAGLTIFLIAIFKLAKGILLLAVAIGALKLLHHDVAATLTHYVRLFRVDPDNRHIHARLTRVFRVTPKQLHELSIGTFIYAGLFLTEGTGLLLRKKWAEYLTILTTGGFIPLELYELHRHITPVKLVLLAVNVAIVLYLILRVRKSAAA